MRWIWLVALAVAVAGCGNDDETSGYVEAPEDPEDAAPAFEPASARPMEVPPAPASAPAA